MSVADKREKFIGMSHVKLNADRSLSNPDYERVALRMAEGMDFHRAWESIGKKHTSGNQRKYRNLLLRNDLFKGRVAEIKRELEMAEDDEIFGEARAMVRQLYREAMALGDIVRVEKAVSMRMELAKQQAARLPSPTVHQPPAANEPEDEEARPVGRPPVEDPQAKRSASDIRKELMRRGAAAPTPKVVAQ